MNQIIVMGRLTADPELKKLGKKKDEKISLCNFTIAVNRPSNREKTDFIRCTAFRKVADVIKKYVKKGNRLLIEGEMNIDNIEDDEGEYRSYPKILVKNIEFIDSNKVDDEDDDEDDEQENTSKTKKKNKKAKYKEIDDEDGLPF